MNPLRIRKLHLFLACASLCFLTPDPAGAATGGEVAIAAGVAAGATVLGPVVAQAMTYSTIQVEVQGFAETVPLEAPNGGNLAAWNQLSPDLRRSSPFVSGNPVALQGLRTQPGFGVLQATVISDQLEQAEERFKQLVKDFDETLGSLKPFFDSDPTDETVKVVKGYFEERKGTSLTVSQAITDYRSHVRSAREDGVFSPGELTTVSNLVEGVRSQLLRYPADIPPAVVSLFTGSLRAIFAEAVTGPGNAAEKAKVQKAVGTYVYSRLSSEAAVGKHRLASALHLSLDLLRQAKASPSGEFVFPEGTNRVTARLNTGTATSGFQALLKAVGIHTPVARLLDYSSAEALAKALDVIWLPLASTQLANDALSATYYGLSVGANFGPIINEVMQSVFSKSQMIDALSDETRWKRLNFAESRGRAGDHNTVIYFDNALTPILKTATFDPSEFIEANMALYEKVTDAAAAIYGIPLPGAGSGGTPAAPNSLDSLNVFSTQARAAKAKEGASSVREAMIETLKQAIALHEEVQKKAKDKDAWNGADAAEKTAAGKAAVKLVADGLEAAAAKLSKAETK